MAGIRSKLGRRIEVSWQLHQVRLSCTLPAKGASKALGVGSFATDMAICLQIRLLLDASAARSILERRGLGKLRHVEVADLWLQEGIARKESSIEKVRTEGNISDLGTKPLPHDILQRQLRASGQELLKATSDQ